jgi:MSHA biogenesis protein MshJ
LKEYLQKLALRIDALNLRERVMVFAAAAAVLVYLVNFTLLGPALARQKQLTQQIVREQNNIAGVEGEIAAKLAAHAIDPDLPLRTRLEEVNAKVALKGEDLRAMQKGLVPPGRIAPLLHTILRSSGNLKLVSLRTLPVTGVDQPMPLSADQAARPAAASGAEVRNLMANTLKEAQGSQPAAPAPALPVNLPGVPAIAGVTAPAAAPAPDPAKKEAPKAGELIYRHGVEIVVEGSYLDMVGFMNALESLPTQVFWGKASLDAREYPKSRLTLVLFTLSLDQRWMKL